jgi:hypothetical protein
VIIRLNKKLLTSLLRPYLDRGFFAFVTRTLFTFMISAGIPVVVGWVTSVVFNTNVGWPAIITVLAMLIFTVPILPSCYLAILLVFERCLMFVGLYRFLGFRDYALRNKLCAMLKLAV